MAAVHLLICILIACVSNAQARDGGRSGGWFEVLGAETITRGEDVVETLMADLIDIPFTELARGATSAVGERRTAVVRDQAALSTLYNEMYGTSDLIRSAPSVDFTSRTVIGVFLGTRRTGGFNVAVERVAAEPVGKNVVVFAVETEPPRDVMLTQGLTQPFHLVTIPASMGEIRFVLSVRQP